MSEVTGYTNDDVNTVLKKVYENAVKDREEALLIYELVKQKIIDGSPDAIFLMDKANYLLQTANKNSEILVRLAGVIQRLQTNTITNKKANMLSAENFNKLLSEMDEQDKKDKIEAKFLIESSATGDK
mgnify:CR=1 FL=1